LEAIIVLVGFLGAGKTTLLKKLVQELLNIHWKPFVILNDYENANLDAQDFLKILSPEQINALSGSCICCSGLNELRLQVNRIPKRENGMTLIEANGTTDALSLMGFLGIGMEEHYLPPIQIAVVDVRHWQKREFYNELEANQVQVASLIVLNFIEQVPIERVVEVEQDLRNINPIGKILHWNQLELSMLTELKPVQTESAKKMDHKAFHWASCSVDLPDPINRNRLDQIIQQIPHHILRVKGCTRIGDDQHYSYFERIPSGELFIRPYNGQPVMGPKLLTVGPGSNPTVLNQFILESQSL
jgi:G3E family GTPase